LRGQDTCIRVITVEWVFYSYQVKLEQ
jgi:hypothetical protein